jgi:membrane peptidoglycan carboxypeptidase
MRTNSFISRTLRKRRYPVWFALLGLCLVGFVILTVIVSLISRDLPTPDNIQKQAKFSTTLLDRNGKLIYQVFDDKNIIPITYEELPKYLVNATVAIEDKEFFKHSGFSVYGIFRALVRNLIFHVKEGGSTLTQQLIKNTLLSSEKTYVRKIKEAILAVQLERLYSKEQILEMYFNQTPYGGTAYGIEAASQLYFGKSARDLTKIEAAIIAGLPQSPSFYSPFIGQKGAYQKRTLQVLRRMREDHYITAAEEKDLTKQLSKITFNKEGGNIVAPHFVFLR